jgi:peptide/nickel transport system ATP-binding protein
MSRPVLEARGATVDFGARGGAVARALDGVDVSVGRGEVLALVGESGSGKTTLARMLVGLQRPTRGEVLFEGRPLDYSARGLRTLRRQVQMVLQDAAGSLNPRQTVYESVAEGIRLHKRVAADEQGRSEVDLVAAALAEAGLRPPERLFLRYPHELSGGQKQRVLIAGALALRPQVLLADEPVSSLDASIRGEILALLLKLREETGVGIVVVTHDLGLAWNIADRIAVMYLGRVVEFGSTEEVLQSPRHPYTRALLSVVPEISHLEPIVLRGEIPDPTRIPGGCRFHPRCPQLADGSATAAGVEDRCLGEGLAVLPADGEHRVACHLDAVLTGQRHRGDLDKLDRPGDRLDRPGDLDGLDRPGDLDGLDRPDGLDHPGGRLDRPEGGRWRR